jgi:lipoyl(octanoyl) transferase
MQVKKKVQVWMLHPNGLCLLLQTTKARGGFWQPITGSVEEGETTHHAAIRELNEETGFQGVVEPIGFRYVFQKGAETFEEEVFRVSLASDPNEKTPEPQLDPREHEAFQWVPFSQDLEKRLHFPQYSEILRLLGAP